MLLRSITNITEVAVWGAVAEGPVRRFPGPPGGMVGPGTSRDEAK